MTDEEVIVRATTASGVFLRDGKRVMPPETWSFVPSGDPGLTRRIKNSGEYWLVVRRRRNRDESAGLWADAARCAEIRRVLESERADPAYQRKLDSARRRRELEQQQYEIEFRAAVLQFLKFHVRYAGFAGKLADAVTAHAVPVGSGTVARTERIPVERRAEAAVIAWMRHQTTAYDNMSVARVKGARRELRRNLAAGSRQLLERYRAGAAAPENCPLAAALGEKF